MRKCQQSCVHMYTSSSKAPRQGWHGEKNKGSEKRHDNNLALEHTIKQLKTKGLRTPFLSFSPHLSYSLLLLLTLPSSCSKYCTLELPPLYASIHTSTQFSLNHTKCIKMSFRTTGHSLQHVSKIICSAFKKDQEIKS